MFRPSAREKRPYYSQMDGEAGSLTLQPYQILRESYEFRLQDLQGSGFTCETINRVAAVYADDNGCCVKGR